MSDNLKKQEQQSDTAKDAEHCFDFDEIMPYMGEFGFYQKRLVFYMLPFLFLWTFMYLVQIFLILVPPDHWCYIPELAGLSKNEQLQVGIPKIGNDEFDRCNMYDVNYTAVLESNITMANESWPQIPCQDWVYDKEQVPYESIATQNNWVCKYDDLGAYSVAIFFVGAIVGSLVYGYVTDHWGRIPSLMISNLCGLVGGVLSATCNTFLWFSVTRFVVGLSFDNLSPLLVLVLEFVGAKYRAFVTNFTVAVYFTTAAVLLPWIAYWCNDWRLLAVVTSAPIVIPLLMYFLLSESPRWLITIGKTDQAILIIKDVAKVNGKTIPDNVLLAFRNCCELSYNKEHTGKTYTILDLFKRWRMGSITVILCIIWMITELVYDAHVRVIIEIGPDVFITFSVACLTEFPGSLLPLFLVNITGRKVMSFGVFVGCALGSFVASMLTMKWQVALAAIVGRFCATAAYNVSFQWSAELLPTVLRGQGLSLIHTMGCVALLLSPFVVYTEHYSPAIPMIILGALSVLAAILVLLLPETKNLDLPQTIAEAENLGR